MSDATLRIGWAIPLLVGVVSGCSGAAPKQQGQENAFDTTLSGKPVAESSDMRPSQEASGNDHGFTEDQKAQMQIALRRGGVKAAQCADPAVVPHAPRAEGEVKVKFDGKKGVSVDVEVPAVFAEPPKLADCIKNAFLHEYVLPFDGQLVVPYTLKLEPKGG